MTSSALKLTLQNKIKPYSKCILNLSQQNMRTILRNCILFIENQKFSKEVLDLELSKMDNAPQNYFETFTALYILLTTIFKYKKVVDMESILKELKFSAECTEDLLNVIENQKDPLSKRYFELKFKQNFNNHYQYRINMGVCSQLSITLQLQYKGSLKTFQLSVRQFQRLRLVIAKLLSEMQILEK